MTEDLAKVKKKSGPKNKLKDPVHLTITIEKELRDKVAYMFPGQTSQMICGFLGECVKGMKVMVFKLK